MTATARTARTLGRAKSAARRRDILGVSLLLAWPHTKRPALGCRLAFTSRGANHFDAWVIHAAKGSGADLSGLAPNSAAWIHPA